MTRHSRALWLAVLAWAGVIFVFSAQPDLRVAPQPDLDFALRKAGHMLVFGVLAVLLRAALQASGARRSWQWSLALTVLYAISDEVHQSFTPGRHAAVLDVAIDASGAALLLACGAVWQWRRRRPRAIPRRPAGPGC